ncbi:MAG TPA: hypothetical protein VGE52_19335, partial [Pirellulales bacterium]
MEKPFDPYYLWLGIPPAEQPPHHYRLLGLTLFESDPAVIVEAADRHMAYVQTFKLGKRGPESQRLLNELSQARLCLTNAEKKKAYDAALMETSGGPFPRERPNAASSVDEAYPSSERSTSAVGIAPMIVFPPHRFSAALPSDDPSSGELGRSRLEVSPNEDGNRDALAGPLRNGTESVPASPSARRTLGQTLRQPFAAGIVAAMLAPVIALMLTPRSHRSTDALVAPPLAEATGERESGVALMREAEKEPAPQRMVRVDGSQINAAPGPTSAPPAVVEATVRLSVNVAPQPGVIAGQRRNLRRAAAMISTQTAKLGTELAPDFVLADRTAWLAGESRFPDPPAFAPAKPAGWDVPPDADLAKARVTVKERFGEELAEARRFGNADDVAYRMAAAAQRGEPPPDMVYALLERAREAVVSVDADSPKMIWRLWDAAGARFNIDCTAEKLSTLRTLETRAESLLAAESTERAAIESE